MAKTAKIEHFAVEAGGSGRALVFKLSLKAGECT